MTLNLPDWAGRVDAAGKGRYEFMVQGTTADNNDPDGLAPLIDGDLPANMARSWQIPTPEIHALFAKGRAEFDPAKRKAIYAELETLALQQAPLVGLAWRSQGYGMVKGVTGFKSLPGGTNFSRPIRWRRRRWRERQSRHSRAERSVDHRISWRRCSGQARA